MPMMPVKHAVGERLSEVPFWGEPRPVPKGLRRPLIFSFAKHAELLEPRWWRVTGAGTGRSQVSVPVLEGSSMSLGA